MNNKFSFLFITLVVAINANSTTVDKGLLKGCFKTQKSAEYAVDKKGHFEINTSCKISSGYEAAPTVLSNGTIVILSLSGDLCYISPDGSAKVMLKGNKISHITPVTLKDDSLVAVIEDTVYFMNPDGTKRAEFNASGKKQKFDFIKVMSDGTIAVVSFDRNVYFLNPDGTKKASVKIDKTNLITSLEVLNDQVVAGDIDGNLHFLKSNGSRDRIVKTKKYSFRAPSFLADGTVVTSDKEGVVSFYNSKGTEKAEVLLKNEVISDSPVTLKDGLTSVVVTTDGNMHFVSSKGENKALFQAGKITKKPALLDDGTVVVGSEDGNIYFLNPDGSSKGKFTLGPLQARPKISPVVTKDGTVLVLTQHGALQTLKLSTKVVKYNESVIPTACDHLPSAEAATNITNGKRELKPMQTAPAIILAPSSSAIPR